MSLLWTRVVFVDGKYPGDRWKHLEALNVKITALQGIFLKSKQAKEAKQIASKMLSITGEMGTTNPSLTQRFIQLEAPTYNSLGTPLLFKKEQKTAP